MGPPPNRLVCAPLLLVASLVGVEDTLVVLYLFLLYSFRDISLLIRGAMTRLAGLVKLISVLVLAGVCRAPLETGRANTVSAGSSWVGMGVALGLHLCF